LVRSEFRSTGDRGIAWFLFVSLLFHGIFLVVLLIQKKPISLGYPQATSVTLVSENDLKEHASTTKEVKPQEKVKQPKPPVVQHPKPSKPLHREERPVVHSKPATRLLKKIPKKKAHKVLKSVKKILAVKKASHPKTAMNKEKASRQKSHTSPATQSIKKSAVSSMKPNVPVKMDMVGQRFPSYLQHLLISRIKSNWAPPPGSHGLNATLSFVLRKNGTLAEDPIFVTRSGSSLFDEAAKFAILRSVPFPAFPASYGKDKEIVTVTLQALKRQGF